MFHPAPPSKPSWARDQVSSPCSGYSSRTLGGSQCCPAWWLPVRPADQPGHPHPIPCSSHGGRESKSPNRSVSFPLSWLCLGEKAEACSSQALASPNGKASLWPQDASSQPPVCLRCFADIPPPHLQPTAIAVHTHTLCSKATNKPILIFFFLSFTFPAPQIVI